MSVIYDLRQPMIYTAGTYSGKTDAEVEENIEKAAAYRLPIAEAGGVPICPHTMTRGLYGTMTPEFWYQATMAIQRWCHGTLFLPTFFGSVGSLDEHAYAVQINQPVAEAFPHDVQTIKDLVERARAYANVIEAQKQLPDPLYFNNK